MSDEAARAKLPRLRWHAEPLAIVRLPPTAAVPVLPASGFFSLTRTADELSLVVEEAHVPAEAEAVEPGWHRFAVVGPLDFSLVGVLSHLSGALAEAGISLFVISTYDTDIVLVRSADRQRTTAALEAVGYRFV